MKIELGRIKLDNPFILAPMAGVTDRPFRVICKQMGTSLVYSEMVSAKGMFYGDKNTEKLLLTSPNEQPVAFQIFGSEPDVIKYAAENLADRDNVILDINMGCPVPKIVKNGEGSALMKNPDLVYQLVKVARSVSGKPVTAKIRLGWDKNSINGVEVAQAIESAGAEFIAVHGRTREEFYNGTADWEGIAKIKQAINIPVVGNGDIFTGIDGVTCLTTYGVDAVMIGRGAMGNPFIFRELTEAWAYYINKGNLNGYIPVEVTLLEKMQVLLEQFNLLIEEKGEYVAVRQIRSHGAWYLKGVRGGSKIKQQLNSLTTKDQVKALFSSIPIS